MAVRCPQENGLRRAAGLDAGSSSGCGGRSWIRRALRRSAAALHTAGGGFLADVPPGRSAPPAWWTRRGSLGYCRTTIQRRAWLRTSGAATTTAQPTRWASDDCDLGAQPLIAPPPGTAVTVRCSAAAALGASGQRPAANRHCWTGAPTLRRASERSGPHGPRRRGCPPAATRPQRP